MENLNEQQRKAVEYMRRTAGEFQVDVSTVDIADFLSKISLEDNNSINGFLIERLQKESEVSDEEFTKVEKDLQRLAEQLNQNTIDFKKTEIANQELRGREYYNAFNNCLKMAFKVGVELDSLQRQTISVAPDFKAIIKNKFWKFTKVLDGEIVEFHTHSDVILKETALNLEQNFGKYKAYYNYRQGTLHVHALERNVKVNSFYHPYIHKYGDICWGTGVGTAQVLMRDRKIKELFELLATILTNYHVDATPYVAFLEFYKVANPNYRVPASIMALEEDICERCENPIDDCDCHYCEKCDEHYIAGDSCGGNFCDQCGECVGSEPCETHYCNQCENDSKRDGVCRNGCCDECEKKGREIDDDGHDESCGHYTAPEIDEEIPF